MKRILTLLICTALVPAATAQVQLIGAKAGFGRTNAANDVFSDSRNQNAISAGLTYEYVTKRRISIGAELLYEQRGFVVDLFFTNANGIPTGENYPAHLRYNYISLPVKLGFSIGKKFFGFGSVDICPALLVKAVTVYPLFDQDANHLGDTSVAVTDRVSKFDIGGLADIGGGYNFSQRLSIVSALRYQHSLTSLSTDEYFKDRVVRNWGMSLSIGVRYCILGTAKKAARTSIPEAK